MKSERKKDARYQKGYKQGIFLGALAVGVMAFFMFVLPHLTPPPADQQLAQHEHVHLYYYLNGVERALPANIGIDDPLYMDHSLDKYSPLSIAPIHTHDDTGVIHVESNTQRDFTFGEFLKVWGVQYQSAQLCTVTADNILQDPRDGCQPIQDYENFVMHDGQKLVLELDAPN